MKKQFIPASLLGKCLGKQTLACVLGLSLLGAACKKDNKDNNDDNPSPNENGVAAVDKNFALKATSGNYAEIQLGKLAASRAIHDSVKWFGKWMVDEHNLALNELLNLARTKSLAIDTTLDSAHVAKKNLLLTATGKRFDSLYVASQIEDHHNTQDLFQTEINQGQDQDLKNYANKYLPHINSHYANIVRLKDSIK